MKKRNIMLKVYKKSLFVLSIALILISAKMCYGFPKQNPYFTLKEATKSSQYQILPALVVDVHDGDTIRVLVKNRVLTIRIRGVDCFEVKSNFPPVAIKAQKQANYFHLSLEEVYNRGNKAQKLLVDHLKMSKNRVVLAINKKNKKDIYDRTLAYVFIKKQNVNEFLINSKNCFVYKKL